MTYLKRNKALIQEIRDNHILKIGNEIARSDTGMVVYSLGHYTSKILGKELHLALKDKKAKKSVLDIIVSAELGLFRVIGSRFPHLLQEFPIIYGMIIDNNNPLGVLTEDLAEDFTEGGLHKIFSYHEFDRNLPMELAGISKCKLDEEDMATTCFSVNGQRRFGDFEEFYKGFGVKDWDFFPCKDIYDKIEEVTLKIGELK